MVLTAEYSWVVKSVQKSKVVILNAELGALRQS